MRHKAFLTGNNEYGATGYSLIQPLFRQHWGQTHFQVCPVCMVTGKEWRRKVYYMNNEICDVQYIFIYIYSTQKVRKTIYMSSKIYFKQGFSLRKSWLHTTINSER